MFIDEILIEFVKVNSTVIQFIQNPMMRLLIVVLHILQMNGPVGDAASASNAAEGSAGAAKPWEHVWTVDEMRSTAADWHLANDVGVCFVSQFL